MKYIPYIFYAAILAIISVNTGEIVTFIMLGIILISLVNIHSTLKRILHVNTELLKKSKSASPETLKD